MSDKCFYRGTVLEFFNPVSYNPGKEEFILADCNENGYLFQIICITGYMSGTICGFIKADSKLELEKEVAISYEHLIKEIERNFGKIDIDTLKIRDR